MPTRSRLRSLLAIGEKLITLTFVAALGNSPVLVAVIPIARQKLRLNR